MSDEPLYCTMCGAEDFACDCGDPFPDPCAGHGSFCHLCGVKHDADDGVCAECRSRLYHPKEGT